MTLWEERELDDAEIEKGSIKPQQPCSDPAKSTAPALGVGRVQKKAYDQVQ